MTDNPLQAAEDNLRAFLRGYSMGELDYGEVARGIYDDSIQLSDLKLVLDSLDRLRTKLETVHELHGAAHRWWVAQREQDRLLVVSAKALLDSNSNWSEGGPGFIATDDLRVLLSQIASGPKEPTL